MEFVREYAQYIEWLGILYVVTFFGSLIAVPWIISRLPVNFFIQHRQKVAERHAQHPAVAKITFIARNTVGFVFLLAGIAMLLLPGQGIITILIGVSCMEFQKIHVLVD